MLGVQYQYYFEKNAQVQDTSTHFLTVLNQSNNPNGEFSLQTQVKLTDNFCAHILETAVDYGDGINQLHICLSVPGKFENLTSDVLNSNRDKIHYSFSTIPGATPEEGYLLTDEGDYTWRASANSYSSPYFLQNNMSSDSFWNETTEDHVVEANKNNEYVHYNSFTHSSDQNHTYYPFFINLKNRSALNSTKFLGNLGLVCQDDLELIDNPSPRQFIIAEDGLQLEWTGDNNFFLKYAPCYWAENRPYVKMYQRSGYIEYPMNLLYDSNNTTYNSVEDTQLS